MTETGKRAIQLWEAAAIVLAVVVFYLPALRGGFVFDDWILLIQQPLIHASDGLRRIWFTAEAPDYYPITWTAFWLQWRLWGAWPMGYHIVNVLLHAINAVLVVQVLRRLEIRGAWLAGIVFAVHPVNVAAVAWISEQKTTLAMLFFLMSVLAWLRFERDAPGRWYAVSLLCYLLSLLAKPAAVMWPIVILGLALWKRRRLARGDLGRCVPFLILSLVAGVAAVWFQSVRVLEGQPARTDVFLARLAGAGWAVWFYLLKAAVPVYLTMLYPRWQIDPFQPLVYVPGLLFVLLLGYSWSKRRTWGSVALVGAGYYIVMLFPVLGFFDQGFYRFSFVADHWQYLAIIGVIALIVDSAAITAEKWSPAWQRAAWVTATALVVGFGVLTWNQSRIYFSDETLWRDTVVKNPSAWLAHFNLGVRLAEQGRYAEAATAYEAALKLKPDYADALGNLGMALAQLGKVDEAVTRWQAAARVQPDNIEAHNNLGAVYAQRGDFRRAALEFSMVLLLKPEDAEAHANLGTVHLSQGQWEKATNQFQSALRINPHMLPVRLNLGMTLARLGRLREASAAFQEVLRVDPTNQTARAALEQLTRTEQPGHRP